MRARLRLVSEGEVMPTRGHRSDVIDGFRAFAIFIVLLYHYLVRWAPPNNPTDYYGYSHVYAQTLKLGQYGVHLFFVISGLVIAMTVVKSGSAVDFAVRRFARLYPAFIVAASLVSGAIVLSGGPFHISLKDYLATLTMAPTAFGALSVDGSYWSLLVEVKFYAWTAVSFILLKNRFWMGILAIGALGTLLQPLKPGLADQFLLVRFVPLFLIGMAGWYWIFNGQHRLATIIGIAGLILYAMNARDITATPHRMAAHFLILGGSFAMLALLRFCDEVRLGPIAYLGRASYSWYLVHQRVGVIVIGIMTAHGLPDLVAVAIATAATAVIACALFEGVEKPAQIIVLKLWGHGREHLLRRLKRRVVAWPS